MSTKRFAISWKAVATAFLLCALLITPLSAFAADSAADGTTRNAELSGTLANSNTRHYLGLEANERDGEVTLTLTFDPQSDGRIANKVNFWVLSQRALESTLTGTVGYAEVDLASGSPISGKNDDYKVSATFKVTGKEHYTVIVYSQAAVSVNYTLNAKNGMLTDGSGQTQSASMAMSETKATTTASAASESMTEIVKDSKKVSASIGANERLYYTVVPVDNDEDISLTFNYDPKDNGELNGKLNFFVFDKDGLRRLDSGERAESANLSAGNPVKNDETKRTTGFRAVGKQSYVVMVINRSAVPASFTLDLSGGDFQ